MKNIILLLSSFLIAFLANSQTFTTNTTPVGMEHNLLFNATTNYTVTQTGTAPLNLTYLFDGRFGPSYTSVAPTTASPTVILIEDLPAIHVQTGAWVGWSTRYWEASNFKVEGYNTYSDANEWVTMADYSTTNYTGGRKFSVKVPGSRVYTKLRFTFYSAAGTDGRLGVSELYFIHPEATTPYANLGLGAWSKNGTEISTSSTVKAQKLLLNDPNTIIDWNNLWQSGFYQNNGASINGPISGEWLWGLNMNHSSNSETYKYNGQIAIRNASTEPTMYFRSTNKDGIGTWAKIIDDHGNQTIKGNMLLNSDSYVQYGVERENGAKSAFGITSNSHDGFLSSSGNLKFLTDNNGTSYKTTMFLNSIGNVGIGTTDPKNKLSVNGTIWATKVKVQLTDAADWVFEDDYELRSLAEVENFIKTHKHLPEIPSAEEFRANDMEVAEMTNKLLQKIEELTLYTIEQGKSLKAQETTNAELQARLAKLEALLVK